MIFWFRCKQFYHFIWKTNISLYDKFYKQRRIKLNHDSYKIGLFLKMCLFISTFSSVRLWDLKWLYQILLEIYWRFWQHKDRKQYEDDSVTINVLFLSKIHDWFFDKWNLRSVHRNDLAIKHQVSWDLLGWQDSHQRVNRKRIDQQ